MGKAPNGHGTIKKLTAGKNKGKWYVEVPVGWDVSKTGRKILRRKRGLFVKQADAEAFRAKHAAARTVGAKAPAVRRTVSEQLRIWFDTVKASGRSSNTIDAWHHSIETHIKPYIGGLALRSLGVPAIEAWQTTLKNTKQRRGEAELDRLVGTRTRLMAFDILSQALRHAVKRGDLAVNPCLACEKPTYNRKKVDPFSRDEVSAILRAADAGKWAAPIRLMLSTGMRQGELFGLRPRDIDLIAGTITINRQAVETKAGVVITEYGKTNAAHRTVALVEKTREAVVAHRARMMEKGLAGRELEFVSKAKGPVRRTSFGSGPWRDLLAACGLRHRGAHHLRHTFATTMLGDGVPLHVVSKILGHARPSITADLYAHAIPDQIEEAFSAAGRLFG